MRGQRDSAAAGKIVYHMCVKYTNFILMPVDKGYIICVPVAPGVGEPAVSGEPVAAPSFGKSHSRRVPRRAHRGYARRLCWDGNENILSHSKIIAYFYLTLIFN